MSKPTSTLPKTTMISCSHWNSPAKTSHCEYETQLAEPITLKQGDSCQVRNVFLDASKINSEVIDISEETELEMSFMFYAMMKKTSANLGDMSTDKVNISNGWISATAHSDKDDQLPRIVDRWNANLKYAETGWSPAQFVNPLHNFAEVAMAGYWRGDYSNQIPPQAPGYVPSVLYDVSKSRWAQITPWAHNLAPLYVNGGIAPKLCRYNVDLSMPTNNRAVNEPVYLYDMVENKPYIRTVKFKLPAGVYAREELATKISSLMAGLKTSPQKVNTVNQNADGQGVQNDVYIADVIDDNANELPARHIIGYKTRFDSSLNPFQASIRFGYLSMSARGTANPEDFVSHQFSSNQEAVLQDQPLTDVPEEAIVDLVQFQEMTPDIVGFCDESYKFPDIGGKKSHKNPQVAWTPLCNNFRIHDFESGGLPSGGQYDNNQITSLGNNLPPDGVAIGVYDTQKNSQSDGDYGRFDLTNDTRTNAYNTGKQNLMFFHHWLLAVSDYAQSDVDALVGGDFGTNEISLTYNDNNSGKFAFNFLHTPIQKSVDVDSGSVPAVVRQVSARTQNYRSDMLDPYNTGSGFRSTCYADRDSGILFTGLKATQGGKEINFWETILGFDLDDILVKPPQGIFYNRYKIYKSLEPNSSLLSYEEFQKKSTSSLFGISFQQNQQLLGTNLNNELFNAPDFFGEALPTITFNDTIYESEQASTLVAKNLPASIISDLGGSILCEITGYSSSDLQSGKDGLAIKSIVSLYYLSDNSYISAEQDPFIYFHTSPVNHTISKLKIRFLNPITQQVIPNTVLGNRNSLFLAITQQVQLFSA